MKFIYGLSAGLTLSQRSRAVQISVNLGILEEWVTQMGLPRGVQSHFAPVRDLLNWLQVIFITTSSSPFSYRMEPLVPFVYFGIPQPYRDNSDNETS